MEDRTLFVTEIHGDEVLFRVRTYERDSSAMVNPPPRIRVTRIFKFVLLSGGRRFDTLMDELGRGELTHWEVCKQLAETGELNYEEG